MPELPEVESLRRSLVPQLVGIQLGELTVHRTDLREPVDAPALAELSGRRILALHRRAKYLLIEFEEDELLAVHLGMSGQFTLAERHEPRARHEHLAWEVGDQRLRYVDARRFGLLFRLPRISLTTDRHFVHLGPEPLGSDFGGSTLQQAATRRRGPVKNFLMDSRVVVGVGNIYASEVLHRAGIHPNRRVDRISANRWDRLARCVREVLTEAIGSGGTTFSDYVDGTGAGGSHGPRLAVYDRAGHPCARCGRSVRRQVHAGRSTYYCPGCQR